MYGCDNDAGLAAEAARETGATVAYCGVTDEDAVAKFVADLAAKGPIHILVNNAGGVAGQVTKPIETVTTPEFEQVLHWVPFVPSDAATWVTGQVLSIDIGKAIV